MRTYRVKQIGFIFVFIILFAITTIGQENRQPSQEELQKFFDQYQSAFQEGNSQKTAQLVRENREHARIVAMVLNNQGEKAYDTADYKTALAMFRISYDLCQQLSDRAGEGVTLNNIGMIYQATGAYQQALASYQEVLAILRALGDRTGEGRVLNNIGTIYRATGAYQQALASYQEALTIARALGDRTGEGRVLNNIGMIYYAIGEYQQALSYYQEALIIVKALGDQMGEGATLNNIGGIYEATGEYQQALASYQEVLTIARALGDRTGEGRVLNNIGGIYEATGAYQQALEYLQQALTIRREIGDRAGEGATLNNIGGIYYAIGEYQQALSYYQEALTIRREIGDRAGEGTTLNNIGLIYEATGEYQQALGSYQEALTIRREIGDRAGEGTTLNGIGLIYEATGEYQQALEYLQEALTIFKVIGHRAGEGTTLNNIGGIYEATGEYQQALDYYQEALTIHKALGDRAGEGTTLNNIGLIHRAIGEYQQALEYLQEALTIFKVIGHRAGEGTTLNGIGLIYEATGEYQQALEYLQEALTIRKALGDRAGEGTTLNNIGTIYYAIGEYQQALGYYQEALTLNRKIGHRASEGATLNGIGLIYEATGEYQQALEYLQEALTLSREIRERAGEETTLGNIGSIYEQQEQWREAVGYYQKAIALLEVIRNKAGGSEAKESFLGQRINVYPHTVKCLLQPNAPEDAFVYTERSKARSFLEQLYEASTGVKHGVDPQLLEEESSLYRKLFALEQHLKNPLRDEQREQLLKERNSLEHDLSVLQLKLRTSNPRYAELNYPQPVTVEQVQQEILKEREVLVEYFQGAEEIYIFILSKTGFFTHILKISEKELVDTLIELLIPIHRGSHNEWNSSLAYQLYHLIFRPLEQEIAKASQGKEIKNLIIVPDSGLFYLPFEMLVTKDGETPEYLVDRYPITYAPSASVLKPEILHARQPEQYAQDLLALAPFGEGGTPTMQVAMKATEDLLLSDTLRSGLEGIQPLPYSAGEVQAISRLYPQSVLKIGADATKASFKDHAKGNRYLHLSTHGYLDSEHAMYSGLLFSDGMLQTYEIFNLDIDAGLTVLSACQTGLGELKAGEGLVGLTRAFMYAGSPSVLVSLWSVSDPSTAAFMKRFYRNLNKGMTKAKALQETKIWMKEKSYHTDEHGNVIKHDNPFYWAPFILVGSGGHSLKEPPLVMPTPTVPQKLSQEDVLTLQKSLTELGYNPGPVDGIWGKKTEDALKKFQQDNGLSVTGKLDEKTKENLGW